MINIDLNNRTGCTSVLLLSPIFNVTIQTVFMTKLVNFNFFVVLLIRWLRYNNCYIMFYVFKLKKEKKNGFDVSISVIKPTDILCLLEIQPFFVVVTEAYLSEFLPPFLLFYLYFFNDLYL